MRLPGSAAVVVIAAVALAACSKAAPPKSSAELHRLLLSAATAPSGMDVATGGPIDDRNVLGAFAANHADPCDLAATGFIFGEARTQPVGNTSASLTVLGDTGGIWVGAERLVSYQSDGAHQVLADLRQAAARCPTDGNNTNELKPGPHLGDESAELVSTGGGKQFSYVWVRTGDTLIIVESDDVPVGQPTPLDATATAAYRAFTAG